MDAARTFSFAFLLWAVATSAQGAGGEKVASLLRDLPLSFEANKGQFDRQVRFLARAPGKKLFLLDEGVVLVLDGSGRLDDAQAVVRILFAGRNEHSSPEGSEQLGAITNYFSTGFSVTDVANFARVRQESVYPGIGVEFYGALGRLEYDFIVSAGADPGAIRLRLQGHDRLRLNADGDLVLSTFVGDLLMKKPFAYQEIGGSRVAVDARYAVSEDEARFELGPYDATRPLVIDPLLAYSSFLGGSGGDLASAIALDAAGNIYVTGQTGSTDFPLLGAVQTKKAGTADGFVTKINASGTALVYSTYLGGKQGATFTKGIAVDAAGSAYIAGFTTSTAYPTTSGAYRTAAGASTPGFATKLSALGNALVYSTFIPGGQANAIAVNGAGNAFITGQADANFTTTTGVFQPGSTGGLDAYALKLNPAGTAAIYATRLGGQADDIGRGIAVDAAGDAYIAGSTQSSSFPLANAFQSVLHGTQDAFVAKFDATATTLIYSTYLGGSFSDSANAIALDDLGNAYIAGTTYSQDFPVFRAFQPFKAYTGSGQQGINQAFITKLNSAGGSLVYSSYLGGSSCLAPGVFSCQPNGDDESALAIAVDGAGTAYLAGHARSITFPQVEPIQPSPNTYGQSIPFVARVQDRANATLLYSVALGTKDTSFSDGSAAGVAVDAAGNAYAAGYVVNAFPVTPGALKVVTSFPCCNSKAVVFKISSGAFPTSLSVSNPQPTSADSVTLTAVVTGAVPNGQVTFFEGGNSIATVNVASGVATYTSAFNAGVYELTAVYSGDNKVSRPVFLPVRQAMSN